MSLEEYDLVNTKQNLHDEKYSPIFSKQYFDNVLLNMDLVAPEIVDIKKEIPEIFSNDMDIKTENFETCIPKVETNFKYGYSKTEGDYLEEIVKREFDGDDNSQIRFEEVNIKEEVTYENENCLEGNLYIRSTSLLPRKGPGEYESYDKLLTDENELIQDVHLGVHELEKVIKREVAEKRFIEKEYLGIHPGEEKPFECTICNNHFTRKESLIRHMNIHSGDKQSPVKCEKQNVNHIKNHTREETFKCDTCEQLIFKSNLTQHVKTHTSEQRPFKCELCDKGFTRNSGLTKHMKIHTGEKPFKCDTCEKQFIVKNHLLRHTRIHTGERPFKCDVCDKQFRVKNNLIEHIRTHTGEKPFKCKVCEKSFAKQGGVVNHMRIHTGEKPFKCDKCDRQFRQKSSLLCHQNTHSSEKLFKCDFCEKRFAQKNNLVSHRRIHTGEKPYQCDICEKRFRQQSCLIAHLRMHSGQKPLKCDVCEKGFTKKCSLARHMKLHTGEEAQITSNLVPLGNC